MSIGLGASSLCLPSLLIGMIRPELACHFCLLDLFYPKWYCPQSVLFPHFCHTWHFGYQDSESERPLPGRAVVSGRISYSSPGPPCLPFILMCTDQPKAMVGRSFRCGVTLIPVLARDTNVSHLLPGDFQRVRNSEAPKTDRAFTNRSPLLDRF